MLKHKSIAWGLVGAAIGATSMGSFTTAHADTRAVPAQAAVPSTAATTSKAVAPSKSTAQKDGPAKLSDIPESKVDLDTAIEQRPESIPAGETAVHFYTSAPDVGNGHLPPEHRPTYIMVSPSKEAQEFHQMGQGVLPAGEKGACIMMGTPYDNSPNRPIEWHQSLQLTGSAHYLKGDGYAAVQAIRSEWISVANDGSATLSVHYAWMDMRTKGVRSAGEVSIPLRRVHNEPHGLSMYAYRNGDIVNFFLRRTEFDDPHRMLDGLNAFQSDGQVVSGTNECHSRLSLSSGQGGGHAGTFQTEVVVKDSASKPIDEETGQFRVRPVVLGVSTSWFSADQAPVLSVSAGWAGRARDQFR